MTAVTSILLFALLPASLPAATWTALNPGDLLDGANWSGGLAPNGIAQVAEFTTQPSNPGNFTLNGPMTLGKLISSNLDSRFITGSGTLTFQAMSGNALFEANNSFWPALPEIVLASTTEFRFGNWGVSASTLVTGQGGIILTGNGSMQFWNSPNSYEGLNDVQGGTLGGDSIANIGVNSAFGRGNFAISNAATLRYDGLTASSNRSVSLGAGGGEIAIISLQSVLTLSGHISGSGSLTKSGPGHILLSGENNYAGGTTIDGGTILAANTSGSATGPGDITITSSGRLNVGFGENSGFVSGNIINNGLVDFYRSDDTLYDGQISGSGYIYKNGNGTLTLTGNHTYQGNTYIYDGALKLGADQRLPDSTAVFNNGVLDLNDHSQRIGSLSGTGDVRLGAGILTTGRDNSSTTVYGVISGSGAVVKEGTGSLTLAGINTYTGGTYINNGTLINNGVINGGPVFALYPGTLAGNGFIGTPTSRASVHVLGYMAPGNNSPGTLTVAGAVQFGNRSFLNIEIEGTTPGSYDQLVVNKTFGSNNGTATLDGTIQVAILDPFQPSIGDSFQILFAAGGLSGTFSGINAPASAGFRWELAYTAHSVFLNVVTPLAGDFNGDARVDAADYVVWRKSNGAPADYNTWRQNFGRTAGSVATSVQSIPEPSAFLLLLLATIYLPSSRGFAVAFR